MANVFISHRTRDTSRAEELAKSLRDAGHTVWMDKWRIDVGDSLVEKINEGLEGSAYLVLCYSADGITSPWMSREWMSGLSRQLNGQGVRVLPVLLTAGSIPAILSDIKYADLTTDWDAGIRQLLRSLK